MIPWLESPSGFPPLDAALQDPNGLLCAGGDLNPATIIAAYSRGIFPWFNDDQPILWWSPNPRMVLMPDEFKVTKSLLKMVRSNRFEIRVDTAFRDVIAACAAPRNVEQNPRAGTWIVPAMQEAYSALFDLGIAHSVEAWRDGKLVGGLYGVALGGVFFGESMFTREANASKVALVALVGKLKADQFSLIDCQQETRHLASFGARPISRTVFAEHLRQLIHSGSTTSRWTTLSP